LAGEQRIRRTLGNSAAQPGRAQPAAPDKILTATVLRKRDHKYEPVKGADK